MSFCRQTPAVDAVSPYWSIESIVKSSFPSAATPISFILTPPTRLFPLSRPIPPTHDTNHKKPNQRSAHDPENNEPHLRLTNTKRTSAHAHFSANVKLRTLSSSNVHGSPAVDIPHALGFARDVGFASGTTAGLVAEPTMGRTSTVADTAVSTGSTSTTCTTAVPPGPCAPSPSPTFLSHVQLTSKWNLKSSKMPPKTRIQALQGGTGSRGQPPLGLRSKLAMGLRLTVLLRGHIPHSYIRYALSVFSVNSFIPAKESKPPGALLKDWVPLRLKPPRAVPGRGGEVALESNAFREEMPLAVDHAVLAISCSPSLLLVRQHGIGAEDTRDRRAPTATAEHARLPRQHCAQHCGGWTGVVCTVTPEPSPPGNDVVEDMAPEPSGNGMKSGSATLRSWRQRFKATFSNWEGAELGEDGGDEGVVLCNVALRVVIVLWGEKGGEQRRGKRRKRRIEKA
ncbi:hypothetical protein BV22DRAFT_1123551 [Leucogyrophana mollusca]|uniref:Uncharacterized protein n=1 Tax=Leucogyrophana mollusca TaxID=85980 RepID=A0ACB8B270_9AGAM|nr:hypothetical protein BV22DRAFT_1123551 [Leucogyrophana mollusca]